MNANLKLNAVKFLKETLRDMKTDVSYAYPGGEHDADMGHSALLMLSSKIETLENFLISLEPEKEDPLAVVKAALDTRRSARAQRR